MAANYGAPPQEPPAGYHSPRHYSYAGTYPPPPPYYGHHGESPHAAAGAAAQYPSSAPGSAPGYPPYPYYPTQYSLPQGQYPPQPQYPGPTYGSAQPHYSEQPSHNPSATAGVAPPYQYNAYPSNVLPSGPVKSEEAPPAYHFNEAPRPQEGTQQGLPIRGQREEEGKANSFEPLSIFTESENATTESSENDALVEQVKGLDAR